MRFLLALDQGTTSSRAIVFDAAGRPRASAQREFAQHYPRPGEVEHDPLEIWATQLATAREAIARAAIAAAEIAAIGIANQRETIVLWDRATGAPLHRAIVWQDRRTTAVCEALVAAGKLAMVRAATGLLLDPYFSATKLAWLLDHVPGARARAERGELAAGTIDSWLIWQLTGGRAHLTDSTNASRTSLYNIHAGAWDPALLELFRIPAGVLPQVVPSCGVAAASAPELLGHAIPIGGIAGDQQAALFGQGCHASGMAKNTYGTGCFLLMHTGGERAPTGDGVLATRAAESGTTAQFATEGSVFMGGAVVQWLRDGLGIIGSANEVEALAASVPDSGGVTLVPAFTGLGAPYWDPRARGTIVGLTRGSGRAQIARAALEAIAWQSADLLLAMQAGGGAQLAELRVDGGAAANDLLMQIQADTLGVPVIRPKTLETTALGAAYLAGLASNVWSSREEIAAQWQRDREFVPRWSADERGARHATWRRAVERARDWVL